MRVGERRSRILTNFCSSHLDVNINSNTMERFNREHGMYMRTARSVRKGPPLPWLVARLFYNFFRRHSSLTYRMPAEAASIMVKGRNRWVALFQNVHARKVTAG